MEHSSRFFANRACEYFPCHPNADPERFNCLFCYCPLYALGSDCGGNFTHTDSGVKDCSGCLIPHTPECYDRIVARCGELCRKNNDCADIVSQKTHPKAR